MMQKASLHKLLFGGRRSTDQNSFKILGINGQKCVVGRIAYPLVEIVNGDQTKLLEAVAGLAALPLFARDGRGQSL
jgi:hypothetical protein